MLTVFNRRELLVTFSADEQVRVRDILAGHHIDYQVKTTNPSARAHIGGSGRGRMGSAFVDQSAAYEYQIYVHKDDYERARSLL